MLARLLRAWLEPKVLLVLPVGYICVIFGRGMAVPDRARGRNKRQSIATEKHVRLQRG